MRGLVYRELYLGRRYYIYSFLIGIIISLFGIMVRLSMICGNLSLLPLNKFSEIDVNTYNVFTYIPYMVFCIALCFDGGVVFSDYAVNWNMFIYCTPVSEKKIVFSKMIVRITNLSLSFVIGVLNAIIVGHLSERSVDTSVMLNLSVILVVSVIASIIIMTLSIKYRTANGVMLRLMAVLAVVCVGVMFAFRNYLNNAAGELSEEEMSRMFIEKFEMVRNLSAPFLPAVAAVFMVVGFLLSVKLLKRREK